jgi:hypothetical protein
MVPVPGTLDARYLSASLLQHVGSRTSLPYSMARYVDIQKIFVNYLAPTPYTEVVEFGNVLGQ